MFVINNRKSKGVNMIELNISDLEQYEQLLTDDGRNVSSFFPTHKLLDPKVWETGYDFNDDVTAIGGTMSKAFYRCNSNQFSDLIKKIKQGNSSYVVHFDKFAKSTKDFPLSKVSVLLKRCHFGRDSLKEVVVSRIADSFGVPTVYNELARIGSTVYVASIDFLKPKESMQILNPDKNCLNNMNQSFDNLDNDIIGYLDDMLKSGKIDKLEYARLHDEFVENYVFRFLILRDMDFGLNNIAMIKGQNGKYKWSPNYDYEYCFQGFIDYKIVYDRLNQINKKYPEALEKVLERFVTNSTSGKLFKDLMNEYRIYDAIKYYNDINSQVKMVSDAYEKVVRDSINSYVVIK